MLVYRLQVVPSSLRDLSVQAIVRFPVYALADHGFREFIFWKHLFSVLVNKTINDDHGDYDTRKDTIGG